MRHWRWYSKVLFAILVAAFAYFVWPTPWRYHPVATWSQGGRDSPGAYGQTTAREHRLTGHVEILSRHGWYKPK